MGSLIRSEQVPRRDVRVRRVVKQVVRLHVAMFLPLRRFLTELVRPATLDRKLSLGTISLRVGLFILLWVL